MAQHDSAEGSPTLEIGSLPGADEVEVRVVRANIRAGLFPELAKDEEIGRYRLQRTLGAGAMGVVFIAVDPELRREVAIKLLRDADEGEPDRAARLLREARAMAKLSHPNVVNVFDAGLDQGRVYVVMELVTGESLTRWLTTPRTIEDIVDVFLQAGRGLQAAHAAGLVHRDFKPDNVLVGDDGRTRVLDFGVARPTEGMSESEIDDLTTPVDDVGVTITSSGMLVGTPAYMAPEQILGGRADPRTDQFSFCVSLYEALLGVRPFEAATFAELRQLLLETEPEFTGDRVPTELRQLVLRGLARKRENRFPDMGRLLADLEGFASGRGHRVVERRSVDPTETPRLRAYLDGLPEGLSSHSGCKMDSMLLRVCLHRYPPASELPEILSDVVDAARRGSGWLPEVRVRAALAATCDLQAVQPPDWGSSFKALRRSVLHDRLMGPSLGVPGTLRFGSTLARSWKLLHEGTRVDATYSDEDGVDLSMEHPTGLFDELARADAAAHFEAAVELAGVRHAIAGVHDVSPTGLVVRIRWA